MNIFLMLYLTHYFFIDNLYTFIYDIRGTGYRQELWKAKHPNVLVLDLELASIAILLTKIRDTKTESDEYLNVTRRILRAMIEQALTELPLDEEIVVQSPLGVKSVGVSLEENIKICVLPLLDVTTESKNFINELKDIFLSATPINSTLFMPIQVQTLT